MTTTTTTTIPTDRVLPHSLEAERALLGAIILRVDAWLEVAGTVTAADFYRDAHQRIFLAVQALSGSGTAVDLVTLKHRLTTGGELDAIGGPAYLASLIDGVPRTSNVAHYAEIVRNMARLRAVIHGANWLLADAYDADEDVGAVLDRAEHTLFALAQGDTRGGFTRLSEIIPGVLDQIEAWCRTRTGISGLASGFSDLDALTRGFQPGNLIILASRPGQGKSALALNIAQHAAAQGHSVGIFSLEMSNLEISIRAVIAQARLDGHRVQRGFLRDGEWGRVSQAVGTLSELPLFLDDSAFLSAFEMRSRARRLKAQHGLDFLIVDYTQLMLPHDDARRRENRTQELAAITRALKALAKELSIPVLALSQLSRKVEERSEKRPQLSDLRESGSLEQDADLVLFIHHPERDDATTGVELMVAKHRNGPTGTVRLTWIGEEMRFANLTQQRESDKRQMGDT